MSTQKLTSLQDGEGESFFSDEMTAELSEVRAVGRGECVQSLKSIPQGKLEGHLQIKHVDMV